jgi:hypothetical protein
MFPFIKVNDRDVVEYKLIQKDRRETKTKKEDETNGDTTVDFDKTFEEASEEESHEESRIIEEENQSTATNDNAQG